jgi:hypothetical protein
MEEKLLEKLRSQNCIQPISLQLSSPNLYGICSTVALGITLKKTKLLLHLPSLITKTHPKIKLVLPLVSKCQGLLQLTC